ncbi:hypothetical protein BGZ49_006811 [Haplosporangium sp. Z 27]|nr:hypothetical protein BGZ49_006811 [Haplosporangium sp. Z 27]
MDEIQEHRGPSKTRNDGDPSNNVAYPDIEPDDFYSPQNSSHASRESSLESIYHSSGEVLEESGEEEMEENSEEEIEEDSEEEMEEDSEEEMEQDGGEEMEQDGDLSNILSHDSDIDLGDNSDQPQDLNLPDPSRQANTLADSHSERVEDKWKTIAYGHWKADMENKIASIMDKTLRGSKHYEGSIQSEIFSQPLNSQSKLREKRPELLAGLERTESSRNPYNIFQDTSDSELDEVESDLELKQAYLERLKDAVKPHLKLRQDGDVCYYCGAITPYEMRRNTPYPAFYQCSNCRECQVPEGSVNPDVLKAHEAELRELEGNIHLNNNGWIFDNAKPDSISPSINQQDFITLAKKYQKLLPDYERWWERIVEDTIEDPIRWKIQDFSIRKHHAKYWSRGRCLVAGGMSWTVEEGDLFFQGLRRFGRHNIWAIKEHVKSRSLAEIVAMIQAMEAELARRKYFGLETVRLSEMPMAEEMDETHIEVEERCAAILIDREMKQTWTQYGKTQDEVNSKFVKKTQLFNLKTLNDLSSRIYIQNEGAGMERDVAVILYDALKEWLKPVVKELATLHAERQRVRLLLKTSDAIDTPINEMDVVRTLYAQQKPLSTDSFFHNLYKRNKLMVFDDRPAVMKQETSGLKNVDPMWVMDGLGKKYYLNEKVDLTQAEAPDSDQDMATDDGVSAEEDIEPMLEAPLDISRHPVKEDQLETSYLQLEQERQAWDDYWGTKVQMAHRESKDCAKASTPTIPSKRRRFRASHPLTPTPMSYDLWQEGVERLAANSFALPIKVHNDAGALSEQILKDSRVQSINKKTRTYEQQLYRDSNDQIQDSPIRILEKKRAFRIWKYQETMAKKAVISRENRLLETYAPGYGILPKNATFMHDATRSICSNGYGLGDRDRGGLWLMDKNPNELLNSRGYITVSDTEDEEEEERGWKRQMEADRQLESS